MYTRGGTLLFEDDNELEFFTTFEGQDVSLHREQWERKLRKHDFLVYNSDKIQPTLDDPDFVIRSSKSDDTLLYYKEFQSIRLRPYAEVPNRKPYFVVVVKQGTRIATLYFTNRVKDGEKIWPRS